MKIILEKHAGPHLDISGAAGGFTISGALSAVSRELTIKIMRNKMDRYNGVSVERGDAIRIEEDGQLIFRGLVWSFDMDTAEVEQSVTCYDKLRFFNVSQVEEGSFVNKTPKEITESICKEVGVTFGECPEFGEKIKINCRGKTGYEVLMQVWTVVNKKTGKPYYPLLKDEKLAIIEKGRLLEGKTLMFRTEPLPCTLSSVRYSESSDEVCSALIVTDDDGNVKSKQFDKDLIDLYGYIQKVRDNKVSKDMAEINGGKIEFSASAVGDWAVRTGYAVHIKNEFFEAPVYIEGDKHTYENGVHTMELDLSYDNAMDKAENATPEEEENEYIEEVTGQPSQANVFGYCGCDICHAIVHNKGIEPKAWHTAGTHPDVKRGESIYIPHFKNYPNEGNFVGDGETVGLAKDRIGVFFGSHDEAMTFGQRKLTVYIGGKRTVKAVPKNQGGGLGLVPGNSNEARIWNAFRKLGYSAAATAGIMGNMWRESGFDPTISQIGGGPGRGLCQWTVSDRWQNLIQWASSQGMDHMTVEAQCGFVDHELSGGGLGPWMAKYGSLESFKATDDPAWAVAWFYDVFERGAHRGGDIAKSTPVAQKYYDMWHNYEEVPESSLGAGSAPAALMAAIKSTGWPGASLCAMWVTNVLTNAGGPHVGGNGNGMVRDWCHSSDLAELRPGMGIGVEYSNYGLGRTYGHIALYAGDDVVYSSEVNGIITYSVDKFIQTYGPASGGSNVRWGWLGGVAWS